jgi:hypothetical protein
VKLSLKSLPVLVNLPSKSNGSSKTPPRLLLCQILPLTGVIELGFDICQLKFLPVDFELKNGYITIFGNSKFIT